jgi:choline dehydrogenase-like flavoprotein
LTNQSTHPGRYDAIVVGSGAGGAAAAYRLARAGLAVLVLEKGDRLPDDGSTLDIERVVHRGEFLSREPWRDGADRELVPEEHFNVGGKTKWYGAALLRYSSNEFEADPEYACGPWPIALRDLAPYYDEAERLLDVRTFAVEPALARIVRRLARPGAGWSVTSLPMGLSAAIASDAREAAHFDGFATVAGLKADADNALLARVSSQSNLLIETGAEVTELLPDGPLTTRIGGVRLADGSVRHARSVLLAAGALHSPRLLERYVERHGLATTLPAAAHVGRGLKLHLLTALVAVSPSVKADLLRKTVLLTHEKWPHSSVQPLGFDAELIGTLVPRWLPGFARAAIGARAYGFFLQTEDGSHRDNRVTERQGAAGDVRVLDYDERRTPAAAAEHRRFVHGFQIALLRAGLASFTQRIGLKGTAHACGTLATGTGPQDAVVDERGQVFGLQSLYVVDGSVLPRSSRVNPSLTIMAWALRVAERLAMSLAAEGRAGQRFANDTSQTETVT